MRKVSIPNLSPIPTDPSAATRQRTTGRRGTHPLLLLERTDRQWPWRRVCDTWASCGRPGRSSPARAEEKAAPKTYVVVVGIGKYKDDQIKQRPLAEEDARALFEVLTDKQYLSVEKTNADLLVGADATRENILKTLNGVVAKANSQDLVLFAFIGNGGSARRCRRPPLLPRRRFHLRGPGEGRRRRRRDRRHPEEPQGQHFCAFLDVDFKGFTGKAAITEPSLGDAPYKEFLGDDGSDDHLSIPGRVAVPRHQRPVHLPRPREARPVHPGAPRRPEGRGRQGRLRSRTASSRSTS